MQGERHVEPGQYIGNNNEPRENSQGERSFHGLFKLELFSFEAYILIKFRFEMRLESAVIFKSIKIKSKSSAACHTKFKYRLTSGMAAAVHRARHNVMHPHTSPLSLLAL